jgi:hypothetical protein
MKPIANVGHTKTPDDSARIIEAIEWMDDHNFTVPSQSDFLDLSRGRDFLAEDKTYDVVILHYIYRGDYESSKMKNGLSTSPLSTWGNWHKRLVSTQARLIFVFGGQSEIAGTFIADLSGYKVHKVRTDDSIKGQRSERDGLWIFERIAG